MIDVPKIPCSTNFNQGSYLHSSYTLVRENSNNDVRKMFSTNNSPKSKKIILQKSRSKNLLSEKYNGLYLFPNGDKYQGQWENKKLNSKNGTIWFNFSNEKFEGTFKDGVIYNGKFTYKNSDFYEGNFNKEGKRNGFGKYHFKSNGDVYEGNWLIDKMNDDSLKSKYYFGNKSQEDHSNKTIKEFYAGNFKDGVFSGSGKYTFKDGQILEGTFEKN